MITWAAWERSVEKWFSYRTDVCRFPLKLFQWGFLSVFPTEVFPVRFLDSTEDFPRVEYIPTLSTNASKFSRTGVAKNFCRQLELTSSVRRSMSTGMCSPESTHPTTENVPFSLRPATPERHLSCLHRVLSRVWPHWVYRVVWVCNYCSVIVGRFSLSSRWRVFRVLRTLVSVCTS